MGIFNLLKPPAVKKIEKERNKMKLYKFRSLADKDKYEQVEPILETGVFWCSEFSELNDPMEGVYTTSDESLVKEIYDQKNEYKICSFTDDEGFKNPIMWGYYANGFKGIAIEIEVAKEEVTKIEYAEKIENIGNILNASDKNIKKILTTKLIPWQHEKEYRFLKKSSVKQIKIGEIKAVYFGNPYGNVDNVAMIMTNEKNKIKVYNEQKTKLKNFAKTKGIICYHVEVKGQIVTTVPPP